MDTTVLDVIFTILAGLLMLIGLTGVIIPVLPDMILLWVGALGYGLLVGWGEWGGWLFAFISVVAAIGIAADVWMSGLGAKMGGASGKSLLWGLALGVVGLILTPIGAVIGFILGLYIAEYIRLEDPGEAFRAVVGMGVGYGASFGVKLFLALLIISAWVIWIVAG